MQNLIGIILISAIRNLFANQPDVLTHTPVTGMTEWNFGHHLANEIVKYIFWLNHDLDVTKHNYDNRRPDIIFHKRRINELNFCVIEIKTSGSSKEDIKRIKDDWMHGQLQYTFGAVIVIKSADNFKVTVFHKNITQEFPISTISIPVPEISDSKRRLLIELVNKITAIVKNNDYQKNPKKQAKVRKYENQIDQMVYKLYELTEEEIKIVEGSN